MPKREKGKKILKMPGQLSKQPETEPYVHTEKSLLKLDPDFKQLLEPGTTTFTTLAELRRDLFSMEDLQNILYKSLRGENFVVKRYQLYSLSAQTEGFLGVHYILVIDYDNINGAQRQRCFLKLLNGAMNVIFQIVLSLNAYEKEKFFYEFLLPEFERHKINTSFSPRGYFSKPYLIILEDLSHRGFKNTPKNGFLNLEHCKMALKTLAKFHSTSILYELAQSDELETPYCLAKVYPEMFKEMLFTANPNSVAKKWFTFSLQGLLEVSQLIPVKGFKKKEFNKKLTAFAEKAVNIYDSFDKYKCTILHGDLWSNNFLFKYKDTTTPIDCVLIDYQLLKFGPPALDVLHVIFCNTRKAFRDTYFKQLIDHYYNCLRKCLPTLKINEVLPKQEYLQLCQDLQCLMKLQCICDRCVTFMPDEFLAEFTAPGTDEDMRRYLFEERPAAIVSCFRNKGLFRDLLIEDLLELRDMLNQSQLND